MLLSGEPLVNDDRCCAVAAKGAGHNKDGVRIAEGDPHPPSLKRRSLQLTAKMIPVAILAVLPKCPACLAAYLALGTGIGISLTAATYMRWLLVVLCLMSLVYFAVNMVRRRGCLRSWLRIWGTVTRRGGKPFVNVHRGGFTHEESL